MRGLRFILTFVAFLFGTAAHATEPVLPPIGGESFNVQPWGWTWSTFDTATEKFKPVAMARVRLMVNTNTSWGGFIETDLTKGIVTDVNWLRQAYVSYALDTDTKLIAGRLFLADYQVTQTPFNTLTAQAARDPFPVYGYGAQVHAVRGAWDMTWDVSGNPERRFNQNGNFDSVASSARILYNADPSLQLGVALQASKSGERFSAETTWKPNSSHMLNAVVYTAVGSNHLSGGWIFYEYKPLSWLGLHTQIDYESDKNQLWIPTAGVRVDVERFRFIVDCDMSKSCRPFARLQIRL